MVSSNSAPQTNFGIKIARSGYNALTAPDYGLLFNSSWPSLAIAFETSLTVAQAKSSGGINHNLNFVPLTMVYISYNGQYLGRLTGSDVEITTTSILFIISSGTLNSDALLTIRCYNVDIATEAAYPNPQPAFQNATAGYDPNFGFKVAKPNKNIESRNLNDYIIHTKGQSPAILNVATENGSYQMTSSDSSLWPFGSVPSNGWELIVYPLQTSYIPWFVSYLNLGTDTYAESAAQAVYYDPTYETNGALIINITTTGSGTLVVMRDPLFYPTPVEASY